MSKLQVMEWYSIEEELQYSLVTHFTGMDQLPGSSNSANNRLCDAFVVAQLTMPGQQALLVTQCMSHNACHTMHVTQCMSHNACHTMHVTQCMSHNACHTKYVTQCMSHNECYTMCH